MTDSKGPEPEFVDWLKTTCRYLVLANAGGAALMVGFVGATAGRLEMPWWTSAALALFLVGIILGALVVLGQLSGRWQTLMQKDVPGLPKTFGSWVVRLGLWIEDRTGTFIACSFLAFVLGAAIGLGALVVSQTWGPCPPTSTSTAAPSS